MLREASLVLAGLVILAYGIEFSSANLTTRESLADSRLQYLLSATS